MNITSAMIKKSIIVPVKSPTPKFIPLPIGMEITAVLHSPPGTNAADKL